MEKIAIDVRGVTKTYGKLHAVDDVSLSIRSGEIFGPLGPNGAARKTDSIIATRMGRDFQSVSNKIKNRIRFHKARGNDIPAFFFKINSIPYSS